MRSFVAAGWALMAFVGIASPVSGFVIVPELQTRHSRLADRTISRLPFRLPIRRSPYRHNRPRANTRPGSRLDPRASSSSSTTSIYPVIEAADPAGMTSAPVHQDGTDYSYFVSANIGNSKAEFNLLIDTGSPTSWVMGSACSTEACVLHNTLDVSATGIKSSSKSFNVNYGTGAVKGSFVQADITVGKFTVNQFVLGAGSDVSDDFVSFPMDGILALGRGSGPTIASGSGTGKRFLDYLVDQSVISTRLFAVRLWRATDGDPNTGVIDFGAVDKTQYSGKIVWSSLTGGSSETLWQISVDGLAANGKSIGTTKRNAVIDTGTSLFFLPFADSDSIHDQVKGSKISSANSDTTQRRYLVPCAADTALGVVVQGTVMPILPADYVGQASSESGMCFTNLVGRDIFGDGRWLVGDVFLKNVYTVFDLDSSRIGLAKVAARSSSSTSTATGATSKSTSPASSTAGTDDGDAVVGSTSVPIGNSTTTASGGDGGGADETTVAVPSATVGDDTQSGAVRGGLSVALAALAVALAGVVF